jgi:hypothetical protein
MNYTLWKHRIPSIAVPAICFLISKKIPHKAVYDSYERKQQLSKYGTVVVFMYCMCKQDGCSSYIFH